MSTPSRRRNRSLASCEPCRKGKLRCDHQQPICASCRRRGRESRCWYHPAPLTKQHNIQNQSGYKSHDRNYPGDRYDTDHIHSRGTHNSTTSIKAPSFQTWPFMSDLKFSPCRDSIAESRNEKAHHERLASLVEILQSLRFLPVIENLLQDYFTFISTAIVPKPIVSQILDMIRDFLTTSGYLEINSSFPVSLHNLHQLAQSILDATSSEAIISPAMDVKGLCTAFSGHNLRVETLGLLYTMAARATLSSHHYNKERDAEFMQEMCWRSDSSLRLAREIAPQTTDPIIWLAHENLQLMSIIEGDASESVQYGSQNYH